MEPIKYGRKKSGIKRQLVRKVEDWLSSIEDEELRDRARQNTIVTGGSIASMLLGEAVNDYDIYFRDKETTKLVAEYYVDQFNKSQPTKPKENGVEYEPEVREETITNIKGEYEERIVVWMQSAGVAGEEQEDYHYFEGMTEEATVEFAESLMNEVGDKTKERYRPVFMSQNAITLADKMQIVIRFYGEPTEIHDNYDFVHAMNYYDHGTGALVLKPEALECLLSRTLVYKGSLYPIASVFRTKKFIERGWRITAGEQLKMMWQISELDLKNFDVIREQLTGVDQAYMHQLVTVLKDTDPEKINSSYIAAIIERIFD